MLVPAVLDLIEGGLSDRATRLLPFVLLHLDHQSGEIRPASLAPHMNRRTVERAIRDLSAAGFWERLGGGRYRVHEPYFDRHQSRKPTPKCPTPVSETTDTRVGQTDTSVGNGAILSSSSELETETGDTRARAHEAAPPGRNPDGTSPPPDWLLRAHQTPDRRTVAPSAPEIALAALTEETSEDFLEAVYRWACPRGRSRDAWYRNARRAGRLLEDFQALGGTPAEWLSALETPWNREEYRDPLVALRNRMERRAQSRNGTPPPELETCHGCGNILPTRGDSRYRCSACGKDCCSSCYYQDRCQSAPVATSRNGSGVGS